MNTKTEAHTRLADKLASDCTEIDAEERYRAHLSELYGDAITEACDMLRGIDIGRLIEENAPTDFRCGFADWIDSESKGNSLASIDNGVTYYDYREAEAARDELVSEIRSEADDKRTDAEELRAELDDEDDGESPEADELDREADELDALADAIESIDL